MSMKRDICIDRLRNQAQTRADETVYFSEMNGSWERISWRDYHEKVRSFAKALLETGFQASSKVAILGYNRLEWMVSCIGAQYAGGISVGVYTSSSPEEVAYVVNHSDAEILIVENLSRYLRQVKPNLSTMAKIKRVILMSSESCDESGVETFKEFLARGLIKDAILDERLNSISPSDVATMIYTSGTTGNPKSVMLSHQSLAWTVAQVVKSWYCFPTDRALSYLPLAHIAEQMISIYAPLDSGMQVYLVSSPDAFKKSLSEVQPTLFFGVPRVYEKIYEAIKAGLNEQSALKRAVFSFFSQISFQYYCAHHAGKEPNLWVKTLFPIGQKIFLILKQKIGFGQSRLLACGAAPISKDILAFFMGIDIPIYEVFGQSENCGPTTLNLPGKAKIGSVGRTLQGAEIKIADDGEILIKGPHTFVGYYKDEKATKEVLKNGWLYSGDIGNLDAEGFLSITDRKKDILITAGGKNISPQNLESMLKHLPYVQSAVVVGDKQKYLCALLAPDMEAMASKAQALGFEKEHAMKLIDNSQIHEEIAAELAKINARLAPVEQIKKYSLLTNEFSIDTGEFTPTLKVKRKVVNQKYQAEIERLYQ